MTQRAFSKHSESNHREREQSDFVILSEPEILCHVLIAELNFDHDKLDKFNLSLIPSL